MWPWVLGLVVGACGEVASEGTVLCQGSCDCAPPDTVCLDGRCAAGCPETGCPETARCDYDSGMCLPVDVGACVQDLDCGPPDQICVQGFCRPGCPLTCCFGGTICNVETGYCETDPLVGCRDDRDCDPPTTTCVAGRCLTPRYCMADADCDPPLKVCDGGVCLDGCLAMGCAEYETCAAATGWCALTGGCELDAHCDPPALVCERGGCVPGCLSAGCPAGQVCDAVTGRCAVETPPEGCEGDAECTPPSTVCDASAGDCVPGCLTTGCPDGQACNTATGHCQDAEDPCTNDTNCSPPQTICESGACVQGCLSVPCPGGSQCNMSTGRCEVVDPGCASDGQCAPPDTICEAGHCVPGCLTTPCPLGVDCDPATGRCLHKLGLGEACESSSGCLSGMCITLSMASGAQHNVCVEPCCAGTDCPMGFACQMLTGVKFCVPAHVFTGATFNVMDGGPCTHPLQCQSGMCDSNGKCVEACCTTDDCAYGGILDTCQLWANTDAAGNPTSSPVRICNVDPLQYSPYCYEYPNCMTPPGVDCQSDFECTTLMCDNVYPGHSGQTCSTFCCSNDDCAPGHGCRMYSEAIPGGLQAHVPMCLKDGGFPVGSACTYGDECLGGDCVQGTCRALCCSDADCSAGQTCGLAIKADAVSGLESYVTYCD